MAHDKESFGANSIYSKHIRAGKRRSYFFDVKATRSNDYYLTITESRKRFNDDGYDRHKIFVYKEDFNKFLKSLEDTINYVKTELMPDFDFDSFSHDYTDDDSEPMVGVIRLSFIPESDIEIYIPQKEVSVLDGERITNACGDFMEALGFEVKTEDEPIYRSFWKKILFVFKKEVSPEEFEKLFRKGKSALELKHVDLPSAEQTEKLATAAQKIVDSLDSFEEGVVRLGTLIVLKKNVNGKSKIVIQQINHDMAKILDDKPQLMKSLQTLYELLTGDVIGEKEADNTTSSTAVIE
ncbi:PUR family DNA/RNA-binding protein [Terrimonas sp. NA20]|uniref:PUR family DNA/RNA-binding protein n=1 Tax=Terrimonas ginsenosidimutans TaxID=2908004 RepID=A0ABS9KSC4_9BACT|nr:DUF3276 family protein [Terrimonas ginsenosidimutans]MCG2615193.1 PUR family DNA/RNA-binding protein [Terrimonas ginsenosidimutans]